MTNAQRPARYERRQLSSSEETHVRASHRLRSGPQEPDSVPELSVSCRTVSVGRAKPVGASAAQELELLISRFVIIPYDRGLARVWARVMDEARAARSSSGSRRHVDRRHGGSSVD